jgi:hypothetical protein
MPIFVCEVKTVIVVEASKPEYAELLAAAHAGHELLQRAQAEEVQTREVRAAAALPTGWGDRIPYGSSTGRTCTQILGEKVHHG